MNKINKIFDWFNENRDNIARLIFWVTIIGLITTFIIIVFKFSLINLIPITPNEWWAAISSIVTLFAALIAINTANDSKKIALGQRKQDIYKITIEYCKNQEKTYQESFDYLKNNKFSLALDYIWLTTTKEGHLIYKSIENFYEYLTLDQTASERYLDWPILEDYLNHIITYTDFRTLDLNSTPSIANNIHHHTKECKKHCNDIIQSTILQLNTIYNLDVNNDNHKIHFHEIKTLFIGERIDGVFVFGTSSDLQNMRSILFPKIYNFFRKNHYLTIKKGIEEIIQSFYTNYSNQINFYTNTLKEIRLEGIQSHRHLINIINNRAADYELITSKTINQKLYTQLMNMTLNIEHAELSSQIATFEIKGFKLDDRTSKNKKLYDKLNSLLLTSN